MSYLTYWQKIREVEPIKSAVDLICVQGEGQPVERGGQLHQELAEGQLPPNHDAGTTRPYIYNWSPCTQAGFQQFTVRTRPDSR